MANSVKKARCSILRCTRLSGGKLCQEEVAPGVFGDQATVGAFQRLQDLGNHVLYNLVQVWVVTFFEGFLHLSSNLRLYDIDYIWLWFDKFVGGEQGANIVKTIVFVLQFCMSVEAELCMFDGLESG